MNAARAVTLVAILSGAALLQGCVAGVAAGAAGGAVVAHDRRTAGTVLDDNTVEIRAYDALRAVPALSEAGHVNVTVYNGLALLTGEAPDETLRARAGEAVAGVPKVRVVHNEITLSAPSSLLSRSNDTVLTGRVKTTLLSHDVEIAARTKVVTENGVVFLMGLLTRAEADTMTELARRVGGVQRVVRVFEYLD